MFSDARSPAPLVRIEDGSLGPDGQVRLVVSGVTDPRRLHRAWASSGAVLEVRGSRLRATTTAQALARAAQSLNAGEAQRVAARLFLHTPVATVALGDAAQLRTELARVGAVEVFGEAAATPPQTQPTPKPQQQPKLQLKRP